MILRTRNEVIEIASDFDLSLPGNILIIKHRLRLTSRDFELQDFTK
jgi:hypothetical protein